jgi:osomolarity two-component system phosphorelay intermediate protein YPD1
LKRCICHKSPCLTKKNTNPCFSRASKDFDELSQLGHFLKGSSATLGLTKVKDACEKIQHCKEDIPEKGDEAEKTKAIDGVKQTLKEVQEDYNEVADLLRRFYGEEPKTTSGEDK